MPEEVVRTSVELCTEVCLDVRMSGESSECQEPYRMAVCIYEDPPVYLDNCLDTCLKVLLWTVWMSIWMPALRSG